MRERNQFVSISFKLWSAGIIFFLMLFHLYDTIAFPDANLLPPEAILSFAIVLIGYIWVQEFRDRERLLVLNKSLGIAHEQLKQAEIDAIASLILTEEAKNPYVRGHSKRVAQFAVMVAKEMGLDKEKQTVLERAGILHDIGKIGIVDNILNKPDRLSPEEWEVMRQHPRNAVEILKPLKFLSREKDIILHHHERIDGAGYPDQLLGKDIPLESRVIAVVDSFDAMNSERSYRKPWSNDIVLNELKRVSGTQLDSDIVKVFQRIIEGNPQVWERA